MQISRTRPILRQGRHHTEGRLVKNILKTYEVRHRVEVEDFLQRYHDLCPVLEQARAQISREDHFPASRLALDLVVDPEAAEDGAAAVPQLVLVIETQLPAEEAFNRYESLQENWWLDTFVKCGGTLGLDLEFV